MKEKVLYREVLILRYKKRRWQKFTILTCFLLVLGFFALMVIPPFVRVSANEYIGGKEYYLLYSSPSENVKDVAESEASKLKVRGSGGVVTEKEGNYLIILSLYLSENDAESVSTNLTEINAKYYSVFTPKINIKTMTETERIIATKIIDFYHQTISELYQYSHNLDIGEVNQSTLAVSVTMLAIKWLQLNNSINQESVNTEYQKINKLCSTTTAFLQELSTTNAYSTSLVTYSSEIKSTLIHLVINSIE